MKFELPDLPYDMAELEPYISKKTLEFHLGKHLMTYVTNLNKLISGTNFQKLDLTTIIKLTDGEVFNNAAEVWNHTFYFEGLKPWTKNTLTALFSNVIENNFGTITFFKNSFFKAALSSFGAGWVWLVLNQKGSLEIIHKSNAGNPLRIGLGPLMCCDLWEHAYYLDYQDRRADYLEAFWRLIDWEVIEKRYNDLTLYHKYDLKDQIPESQNY
jgi:Fe-Mn family superoxide dismutase